MPDPNHSDMEWKKEYAGTYSKIFNTLSETHDYSSEIKELSDRIESLERLIKHIFDGHVLIDGQFIKI